MKKHLYHLCRCIVFVIVCTLPWTFASSAKCESNPDGTSGPELLLGIDYSYKTCRPGAFGIIYRLEYEKADTDYGFPPYPYATVPSIVETYAHTRTTNELKIFYDLYSHLSIHFTIPYVSAHESINDKSLVDCKTSQHVGDMALGLKIRIDPPDSDLLSANLDLRYKFATGISPYKIRKDRDLSTGDGYDTVSAYLSLNKRFKHVIPFFKIGYEYNFKEDQISQLLYDNMLLEVDPGGTLKSEIGFSLCFNKNHHFIIKYNYIKHDEDEMEYLFNPFVRKDTTSYKISQIEVGLSLAILKVYLHPSFSFALSEDAPDFVFNLQIPLEFN